MAPRPSAPPSRRFRKAPIRPPRRARRPLRVFPIQPKLPPRPAIAIPVPPSHGPGPPWRPTAAEGSLERPRPSILGAARGAGDIPMMGGARGRPACWPPGPPSPATGRSAPPAGETEADPDRHHVPIEAILRRRPRVRRCGREPAQPSAPAAAGPAGAATAFQYVRRLVARGRARCAPVASGSHCARTEASIQAGAGTTARREARPAGRLSTGAKLEPRPTARPEPKPEPRLEIPMGRDRVEPAMNQGARERVAPVGEPRPIAILKSGVIDGMAYTLYTDGSIEAELPQGTMRCRVDRRAAGASRTGRAFGLTGKAIRSGRLTAASATRRRAPLP